jgi:2-hydroxy-6-oxonona-2,4-dienedioate hydrolase
MLNTIEGRPETSMQESNGGVESIWSTVNGWQIHARVALNTAPLGSPDVVLVHGLVVSSSYMEPLARVMAPDYRVYAPDLPGFGVSTKPGHTLSIPELAEALCRWMDATGLEKPLLLGNSFGCQIAVEFAKRYPHRARGLVLVGPTIDPAARSILIQAMRWFRNSANEPPTLGLTLAKDYARAGLIRAIKTLRVYVSDKVEDKLPYVPTRTILIRGANDPIVPDRWLNEMLDLLPNASLAVIPGVGHTANYTAPLEIARIARVFDRHPAHTLESEGGSLTC